jgi:GntR family transcriptional regulator
VCLVTIDRNFDEPVYQQLAEILRGKIMSGELEPRRPIPSVRQLTQEYGVARATATKSIAILADEGLVRVVKGRGWFVAPRKD